MAWLTSRGDACTVEFEFESAIPVFFMLLLLLLNFSPVARSYHDYDDDDDDDDDDKEKGGRQGPSYSATHTFFFIQVPIHPAHPHHPLLS